MGDITTEQLKAGEGLAEPNVPIGPRSENIRQSDQNLQCQHLNTKRDPSGAKRCADCEKYLGGRIPGSKNDKTIEKEVAKREFDDRILNTIQELLNAQFNIAKGSSYLYRVDEETNKKGDIIAKKHILVDDPDEIRDFLDELEGGDGIVNEHYYYITTKVPDNRALDSLMDRVFGKAPQTINNKISGDLKLITGMRIIKDATSPGDRIQD